MRKLARIEKIIGLKPIPNADAIECATIGGWNVVVKKGEFNVGDLVVYCEIDSFVPHVVAPFLTKPNRTPRTYEGVQGQVLTTVRLRGQLSQGLVIPIPSGFTAVDEGVDVSKALGTVLYEPPLPKGPNNQVQGAFPSMVPRTDQQRIQNLTRELGRWFNDDVSFEVTEKLDGSSFTATIDNGEFKVCSRNWALSPNPEGVYVKLALAHDLENKLRSCGRNYAIQGEVVGAGIQGNPYHLKKPELFIFDVYDIRKGAYLNPEDRAKFLADNALPSVPVVLSSAMLRDIADTAERVCDKILSYADGLSALNPLVLREGVVFKSADARFKAVSNTWLMK